MTLTLFPIQITAFYASNNRSPHPICPDAYPQPPRIQFAVYNNNDAYITLTLFPFIADVVIQIAALLRPAILPASNNPSAHPP
jgi:hypothetical protein